MPNTNPTLEKGCDIVLTIIAALTGLMWLGATFMHGFHAWGSDIETAEFGSSSTWDENCMCACGWTTPATITEEGWKGKTLESACPLADKEVVRFKRAFNRPRNLHA
jgi:hypothetical protein